MYKINDFLRSEGDFYLSQEEAVKLWNSIHIDLKDKPTPKQDATPDGNDLVQKLKQLKEALDAGLITEKEYQEKRQATLSKM